MLAENRAENSYLLQKTPLSMVKLPTRFVLLCRRFNGRWKEEVWSSLKVGALLLLLGAALPLWVIWDFRTGERLRASDAEMLVLALVLLPCGLMFLWWALRGLGFWLLDLFREAHRLPAERELHLPMEEWAACLREAAAGQEADSWQEGDGFFCWKPGEGRGLHVHACGEGRWLALFRCTGGPVQGLGRLKGWCYAEGVTLPPRFKRVAAEGCAFYREDQLAVYPSALIQAFEDNFLRCSAKSSIS